jgi:hypothetical protein
MLVQLIAEEPGGRILMSQTIQGRQLASVDEIRRDERALVYPAFAQWVIYSLGPRHSHRLPRFVAIRRQQPRPDCG